MKEEIINGKNKEKKKKKIRKEKVCMGKGK